MVGCFLFSFRSIWLTSLFFGFDTLHARLIDDIKTAKSCQAKGERNTKFSIFISPNEFFCFFFSFWAVLYLLLLLFMMNVYFVYIQIHIFILSCSIDHSICSPIVISERNFFSKKGGCDVCMDLNDSCSSS